MAKHNDEKLIEIAKEIRGILEKHDVAGSFIVVSSKGAEYYNKIDPSWSVMKYEPTEDGRIGLRFKSKRVDFNSKEEQEEATSASGHILVSMFAFHKQSIKMFESILAEISKHAKIEVNKEAYKL